MTPHRFSGRRGAGALAAAAFAASVHAQQPAPQNPPTFQSGTQVVEVDVRVFGKDGKFITDLRPETSRSRRAPSARRQPHARREHP